MELPVDRVTALGYKIPWDRYIGAGSSTGEDSNLFVDAEDVASIKACSTLPSPRLTELLVSGDAHAQRYSQAMLRVLLNIRDVRILQYTLTLLCDFLQSDTERRVRLFLASGERPLFALLQMVGTSGSGARITSTDANPYVLEHAARAAAIILSVNSSVQAGQASMLAWVQTNLRQMGSSSPKQVKVTEVAVESLMVLFRSDVIKSLFVDVSATPSGDDPLNTLTALLSTPNSQILYDALHCLWLLSLGKRFHGALQACGAPLQVIRALRPGLPVKVQRMGVGFLVNLMKNPACLDTITLVVESAGISVLMEAFEAAVALAAGGGGG